MKIFRIILATLCLGFIYPGLALTIPAKPDQYINDYAHLLSPTTVDSLNQKLAGFEQTTSNQIVYAIFPSGDNENIEDFTTRLEDQWRIGQKGKDNGILVVIFVKEHQVRIEVGYGLEGAVPDALAMQIIANDIAPNFKVKKYDAGVAEATAALIQAIQAGQPTQVAQDSTAATAPQTSSTAAHIFNVMLEPLLFIVVLICLVLKAKGVNVNPFYARKNADGTPTEELIKARSRPWIVRFLLFIFKFLFWVLLFIVNIFSRGRGGRSGGGGFSGGGGGRSGGGGASGGW